MERRNRELLKVLLSAEALVLVLMFLGFATVWYFTSDGYRQKLIERDIHASQARRATGR